MKNGLRCSLFSFLFFILTSDSLVVGQHLEKTIQLLHSGWEYREAGKDKWFPAEVPGCVHTDLLANSRIDDPFFRDNETRLQWIGKTDWVYRILFPVSQQTMKRENIELVFEGLDTYADVFLNDECILHADNMFREWRIDVKENLKVGDNILRVIFRSPINVILPAMGKMPYQLPASNDQGEKTSPFTRKAPYHFGWDWGPRFVTCGIWQPVYLESWDRAKIDDLWIRQNRLNENLAHLTAFVEIRSTTHADAMLTVQDTDRSFDPVKSQVTLKPGMNRFNINVVIKNPHLWWPNGMGDHPLYTIASSLSIDNQQTDTSSRRIGLRTLELRQEPDDWGRSFTFVINGIHVFAKGGNWIPADNFVTRITPEHYRRMIRSCKDARMNMIRVWGGGIYENDVFYDLCDEMGILVWQDFMFACSMYPGDEDFLENVRKETTYQVRRLRNHPCIALWCGNNEVETAWFHWGWKERLPDTVWEDYKKIFHGVLPEVCSLHDPATPYWPSSPSSNLEADANSQKMGDVHYWDVWHGAQPFQAYETQFPRFNSEYGFQSFPALKTVNVFTIPEDHDIASPVMLAHQKHPRGNRLIREYMLRHFPGPRDFASFLYVSQVLQAEGIKIGAEHLRRIMPRCMGSLYWQINDCWPVASWSGIDYFGRWKALHYYARRFYDDLLISPNEEDGVIRVYVISDRQQKINAELDVMLMDFDVNILKSKHLKAYIEPMQSGVYTAIPHNEWLDGEDLNRSFLYFELQEDGKPVSSNYHFFTPVKDMILPKPNIHSEVERISKGFRIILSSDKLALNVCLSADRFDGYFTDNFFHILPGRKVVVEFATQESIDVDDFRPDLKMMTITDAFKHFDE